LTRFSQGGFLPWGEISSKRQKTPNIKLIRELVWLVYFVLEETSSSTPKSILPIEP